jgi:hypothetical protein
MIKLENNDVGLATVHARMRRKVRNDPATIFASCGRDISEQPGLLRLPIFSVVLAPIRREALATPRLQLRLAAPHRWKRLERLDLAAFRARSHEGERADWSTSRE